DTPGRKPASVAAFRPDGSALMMSASSTCCRAVFCTSTIGDSPVTVIVSSTAPTRMSAFTSAVNDPVSSTPSRRTVLNPGSVMVTVYVPGRRFSTRYWPASSVTTERTFSHSAGRIADDAGDGRLGIGYGRQSSQPGNGNQSDSYAARHGDLLEVLLR